MRYQISGLYNHQLWIVYATNSETAEYIASLFRESGHTNVSVKESETL